MMLGRGVAVAFVKFTSALSDKSKLVQKLIQQTDNRVVVDLEKVQACSMEIDGINKSARVEDRVVAMFHASLGLLSNLCHGRNRHTVSIIRANAEYFGVTYNMLMEIIICDRILFSIRKRCCQLFECLWLDQDPHEQVPAINLMRICPTFHLHLCKLPHASASAAHGEALHEAGSVFEYVHIRDFCVKYLDSISFVELDNAPKNSFLCSVLMLLHKLAKFGCYHVLKSQGAFKQRHPDLHTIRPVVDTLVRMLNESFYVYSHRHQVEVGSRYQMNEETLLLLNLRESILTVLMLIFDFEIDDRISTFFDFFNEKLLTTNGDGRSHAQSPPRGAVSATEASKSAKALASSFSRNLGAVPGVHGSRASGLSGEWLRSDLDEASAALFHTRILSSGVSGGGDGVHAGSLLTNELLHILRYESPSIRAAAFTLLSRHMSHREILVRTLARTQILFDREDVLLYFDAMQCVSDLRKHTRWLESVQEVLRHSAKQTCHSALCRLRSMLEPRHRAQQPMAEAPCTLGPCESKGELRSEQRFKFQNILRELNAHTYVLSIIHLNKSVKAIKVLVPKTPSKPSQAANVADPIEFDNPVSYTDLLQEAYQFIVNFCPGNLDNQELMFVYLPYFVTHHTQMPELMTATAATACIQDNLNLSNTVSIDLVRAVFEALLHNQRVRDSGLLWLTFLAEIIEPANHLSRRNQNLVIKCLIEFGEGVLLLYRTVAEQVERTRLLAACQNEMPISNDTIAYHLACLKLLVRCCSKQNQDGSLYVRTLFRLSDLVCSALQLRQGAREDARRVSHASSRERRMSRMSFKKHAGGMPDVVARALKTPLLQLLLEAFVLFEGDGSSDQLSSADSWIWTTNLQNFLMTSQLGDVSLLQMLIDEIRDFVSKSQPPGETDEDGEFSAYIYNAVLPFIAGYAKLHVTDTMRFSPVFQGILESMSSVLHYLQIHANRRSHSDIICTVASELHIRLDDLDYPPVHRETAAAKAELLEVSSANEYLHKWRSFCDDFAVMVGTRDAKRFLGIGTQNLALLLSQNSTIMGARFNYPTLL